jgi:hypothetical protein
LFSGIKQQSEQQLIKPQANKNSVSERDKQTGRERQRMTPRGAFFMGVASVFFRAAIFCHDTCLFGRPSTSLTICF